MSLTYKIIIQYSNLVEVYERDFRKSAKIFINGLQEFSENGKEKEIVRKQYSEFLKRMVQRFERDVAEHLSEDGFRDEFEHTKTEYCRILKEGVVAGAEVSAAGGAEVTEGLIDKYY